MDIQNLSQNPSSFGRMLILLGVLSVAAGCIVIAVHRLGIPLGRLPGDISLRWKNVSIYAPIATCLGLSVLLSLFFWLVSHFRR